ncbi:MAG: hypothetical protein GF370_02590 [Candidatus Nealsonbacteria bacterium]|nr:hypothetical protein [Candidatus Nealsonbacteria bacterium]
MPRFVYCEGCDEVLIRTFREVKRNKEGEPLRDEKGNIIVMCRCGFENHIPPSCFVW